MRANIRRRRHRPFPKRFFTKTHSPVQYKNRHRKEIYNPFCTHYSHLFVESSETNRYHDITAFGGMAND
jgi:hypothetical protein